MLVYKKRKSGFIETLQTDGSFVPKGWSKTRAAAEKKK